MAATQFTDHVRFLAERLQWLLESEIHTSLSLTPNSRGTLGAGKTLYIGADYRFQPTVAQMKSLFETGVATFFLRIPDATNLAHYLIKFGIIFRNQSLLMKSRVLHEILLFHA